MAAPKVLTRKQGTVNTLAANALTKQATIHKLTSDLTALILDEEAFGSGKKNVLIKLGFDGNKFQVTSVDTIKQSDQKVRTVVNPSEFNPAAAGLAILEKAKAAEGGAWSGSELNKQFKLTPAVLHRRRKEHRIIFWRDAQHEFHYPKWQFTESGALLRGVEDVLNGLKSSDEWRIMRYFLVPRHQLGERRPLDLLRGGEVEKVVAHAKANGEENSW